MTQNLPEPSRRSFIVRLTKSILQVASELNKLAEAWQEPATPSSPAPTPIDPVKELQQQQSAQIRAIEKLPSTYHIFLLQCFDEQKTIAEIPLGPDLRPDLTWEEFVGKKPQHVVDHLQEIDALVRSELSMHLAHKFSYAELAALLKARRLPRHTTKQDMATALAQSFPQEMWDTVDDLVLLEPAPLALATALACLQRVPIDTDQVSNVPASDQPDADSARKATLHDIIRSTLKTAADGIIGNRADAAILALIAYVLSETSSEASEQPTSDSPLPTPVQESPLPAPPPEPPAQATRPARSTPTPQLAFDWVTIPAGTFLMGSDKTKDKDAFDRETPQHQVYLPAYRIARVPVTNAEYKRFVDIIGHHAPVHWPSGQIPPGKDDHPVVGVTWHGASAFCQWAGVRLPSEAEWEKAAAWDARHRRKRIYPWGDEFDATRCNSRESEIGDTTPVDKYPTGVSAYGVLDMAGNVWEWTSSLYKGYPYHGDDGREDPVADGGRVVRGGSFGYDRDDVRCASRDDGFPDDRYVICGFRVVSPGS